jgi:hypothetical protein
MTRLALALAMLVSQAVAAQAQPAPAEVAAPDAPTVGVSLDRTEAQVGDRLTLTVSAVAKAGILVTLPGKLELGKLEVLDRDDGERGGRDLGDGRRAHRFVLGVAAYELGELEVPPIELSYLNPGGEVRGVRTAPMTLTVKSLTAESAAPAPQPLRPPRTALVPDQRVTAALKGLALFAAALALLALFVRLVRRARRTGAAEVQAIEERRPPDEVAMERLGALRRAGHYEADSYRPFYFAVAEVVRGYLGARYGFDALELTTTELLSELAAKAPHLCEEGSEVVRFLADTDLVKFAKTGSTDEAALGMLKAAQSIVLSTSKPLEQAVAALSGPVRPPKEAEGG